MNRFFSKLNLQDIKIDPEGSRFPPDADEYVQEEAEPAPGLQVIENPVDEEAPVSLFHEDVPEAAAMWDGELDGEAAPSAEQMPQPIIQSDIVLDQQQATLPNGHVSYGGIEDVVVGADGEVLKVSARSRPSAVAGAIAGVVREAGRAEVQAIGAGATNQAVKAVAIARDYLRETSIDVVCIPAFIDVMIDNEERTAIRLIVEPR